MTFECESCGRTTPDDESGCYVDVLCDGCTPAAGRCLDCAAMRAEDQADWMTRYVIETEVCS